MLKTFKSWYQRYFSDPQIIILLVLLMLGLFGIMYFGNILAPLLIAILLAYLLDSAVKKLESWGVGRTFATTIILLLTLLIMLVTFFVVAPILYQQFAQMFKEFPNMLSKGQSYLLQLPESYPEYFSQQQVEDIISGIKTDLAILGQTILSVSPAFFKSAITVAVYLVLLPILVFFLLKDKQQIRSWLWQFVPHNSDLSIKVWQDVDEKIGSYVRGKLIEIGIIWLSMYVIFAILGLKYAFLLSFLVGLSVIIPYIGAVVVTVPVFLIAFFQWGFSYDLLYVMVAYQLLQIIDGNILVPLLFSEVVSLHPVAIITAVMFFGGIWGLWGVFFAIPLATLVQAIVKSWPTNDGL